MFILVTFIIIIGCFLIFMFIHKKDKINNPPIVEESTYNPVTIEKAEFFYQDFQEHCQKYSKEESLCLNNDSNFNKMIGYSYENEDYVMYLNRIQVIDNKVYDLEKKYLGEYEISQIENYLDQGTTYLVTYEKKGDNYYFSKIEQMNK